MKKVVITCGLIAGGIVCCMWAISMIVYMRNPNFDGGEVIGYTSMLLAFSMIFVGVKMFRDKHNGGMVTFGKAFLIGLYISLIASTMYVVAWAIEYNFIFPDFMEKYSVHMIEAVKKAGKNQAEIDAKLKEMKMYREWYKNPIFFTLLTYAEILPVGVVVSLLSALILKKGNKKGSVAA